MLTFSVNKEPCMYNPRVIKLVNDIEQGKIYSEKAMSKVVNKILDDGIEVEDISAYSREVERQSQLARAKETENEDFIITLEEVVRGYKGCLVENMVFTVDTYDDLYKDSIVEDFLVIRERIYRSEGKDIYRLLELSFMFDKRSIKALQELNKVYDELPELIEEVITNGVFEQIHTILA